MAVNVTEVRSGAFVVLAAAVLVVLLFAVGRVSARFQRTVSYYAYLDDAKFLRPHDPVTYAGLRVGEVTSIAVAPDRPGHVRVDLEVEERIPVRRDAVLVLKQDGMLGAKYLEIGAGSPQAEPAAPGSELKGLVPPALTDLTSAIEQPLATAGRVLQSLETILGSPENQKNLAETLDRSRALLVTLDDQIRKVSDAVARDAEKTSKVLDDVHGLVRDAREPLLSTLKNSDDLTRRATKAVEETSARVAKALEALTARLEETLANVDRLTKDLDSLVVQNNANVYETLRSLKDASHHLEMASKRIRANPSIVLFGAEETPEELRRLDETELRLKGRARRYDKETPR